MRSRSANYMRRLHLICVCVLSIFIQAIFSLRLMDLWSPQFSFLWTTLISFIDCRWRLFLFLSSSTRHISPPLHLQHNLALLNIGSKILGVGFCAQQRSRQALATVADQPEAWMKLGNRKGRRWATEQMNAATCIAEMKHGILVSLLFFYPFA